MMGKFELQSDLVGQVQDLIRVHIDAYDGMMSCAEAATDISLQQLLKQLAMEHSMMASELQEHVDWNGEAAAKESSFPVDLHEAWLNIHSKAAHGSGVVLGDIDRLEGLAKDVCERVLACVIDHPMSAVLLHHVTVLNRAQEEIRTMQGQEASVRPLK